MVHGNNITLINILIVSTGVNSTVTFPHDTEQCLEQLVEYQCTVEGTVPPVLVLSWRILDDNGMEIVSESYTSATTGNNVTIGVFTVEQLQLSPIISNISFTVPSSINGYTILCEDGSLNNENLTINITGMVGTRG